MTTLNTAPLEDFLRETIGLAAESLGRSIVVRAARRRMAAADCDNVEDYVQRLRDDERLRQDLIEELVVPETWFFRDRQPFVLLARLAAAKKGPLRLLSLPCSTGEEPYSLAMTLLDAGLAPARFMIDAVDISETALAVAEQASYGTNSFRNEQDGARDTWFKAEAGRWRLDPRVRAQVTFRRGNLFTYVAEARYDFIFCRNVLIYFDAPEQNRAVRSLLAVLAEDGVLFAGHAEAAVMVREGLVALPASRAFAFSRKSAETPKPAVKRPPPSAPRPLPFTSLAPWVTPLASKAAPPTLGEIKTLADLGRLDDAVKLARAHAEAQRGSVEGFHLLGIIEDARGDGTAAEAAYRKVLYLDPKHEEAITHLALLLESRGDPEAARLWRRVKRPAAHGGKA